MHLGTPINNPTYQGPSLADRQIALHAEIELLLKEYTVAPDMDAKTIAACMDRADRRITMLRHGVSLVRSEAKKIVSMENRLAAHGKVVCQ